MKTVSFILQKKVNWLFGQPNTHNCLWDFTVGPWNIMKDLFFRFIKREVQEVGYLMRCYWLVAWEMSNRERWLAFSRLNLYGKCYCYKCFGDCMLAGKFPRTCQCPLCSRDSHRRAPVLPALMSITTIHVSYQSQL